MMKKALGNLSISFACACLALGLAGCASEVPIPNMAAYKSGLGDADTPLKRCLLNADFGDFNADFMREQDLQAGYNAAKSAERLLPVNNELAIGFSGYSARTFASDLFLRGGDPLRARMYRAFETARLVDMDQDDLDIMATLGGIEVAENAMLALDAGDMNCATVLFEFVQEIDEAGETDTRFQRVFSDDVLLGYEQVMLYNYRALGYLLAGDKNAIPATIAAAARMQSNRAQYGSQLKDIQAERIAQASRANRADPLVFFFLGGNFVQMLDALDDFKYSISLGQRIANPYLNPLSSYLRAVVAETEAIDNPARKSSEWDTARIAWQQASDLLPDNRFLKASLDKVNAYRRTGLPPDTKLVHIITASGFAPRKKLVQFVRPIPGRCTPFAFNMAAMTPVRTTEYQVFADIGDGELQTLDLMADVEAMAARYHQDRLSDRIASRGLLAAGNYMLASAVESDKPGAGRCLLGQLLAFGANEASRASTKSWTSLPAQMRAIRLEVPIDKQFIRLGLLDEAGEVVTWDEFDLLAEETTVIYARVINDGIWGIVQNSPFGTGKIIRPRYVPPSGEVASDMNWTLGRKA